MCRKLKLEWEMDLYSLDTPILRTTILKDAYKHTSSTESSLLT